MIASNLRFVKSRIDSIKHNQEVQLIAVSKARSSSEIQEAIDAGQVHFGENYLQESLDKITSLKGNNLTWHFIGPIQSNKTAGIAENFDWVHSVDRFKIAKRLSDQRDPDLGHLNILLQINIDREQTKSGLLVENIDEIVLEVNSLPNISLRGFMCIPNPDNSANSFNEMAKLLSKYSYLDSLSMGMSDDLELAIERGATQSELEPIFLERETIIDLPNCLRVLNFFIQDDIMKVRLLITGGTIDKVYNQSNGELEFDKTHFNEMISRARVEVDMSIEQLLLIDSLDMVNKDRDLILDRCINCDEEFVLITHGTDTMCDLSLIHI